MPWTRLDGWSWWMWTESVYLANELRLIRLIQADWNPKRSV